MCKRKSDPDFLSESVDRIQNAVWEAVKETAHCADSLEWDMAIIGNVCDYIEETLKKRGIPTCYPFQLKDETICYVSCDRFAHCDRG